MKARLTPSRLFGNPSLGAELARDVRVSPDGLFATFLKAGDDDRERLDLWGADLATGKMERWLTAKELPAGGPASAAERDERERKRLFGHGITGQAWSDDGAMLLIEASGSGFLFEPQSRTTRQITPAGCRHTDIRLAPGGAHVSYVRRQSLLYRHLASGTEHAVARSQDARVSFGTADFIAQEEMHRYDGHWWSPAADAIAFTRVDVSPVARIRRPGADDLEADKQRYPFAGGGNPLVRLGWYHLGGGEIRWLDYADDAEDYLARVLFAPEGLILSVQNRSQDRLRVKCIAPRSGEARLLFEDSSETWINLTDNLTRIGEADFLCTSERDGYSHLYRFRNGKAQRLTHGPGQIVKVLHADRDRALALGWFDAPIEQHLYAVPLDGGEPTRITDSGWHEVAISKDGSTLVDRSSNVASPGAIRFGAPQAPLRELADGSIRAGHPYHRFLDAHVTPTLGSLEAEDGQTLHFRLTRPANAPGRKAASPLIVWVYGGPGVQIVRNAWPPLQLQLFAAAGYGVLELDNRGSANRGRDFEAPLFRRLGDAEVRDQVTGASYAAGLDWVDAERIGVFGHSYGGYMTLMCLCKAPDLFRAGVSVAPVTDWRLYDSHYTERYLGHPDSNPQAYEASSVFAWLDGLRGKLLVMHGMADDNVLYAHTLKLQRALQSRHLPFELMTYPASKHGLQEVDVSIHRFNLILDFFERSL